MSPESTFLANFLAELARSSGSWHPYRLDTDRFPPSLVTRCRLAIRNAFVRLGARVARLPRNLPSAEPTLSLSWVVDHAGELASSYSALADPQSKDLFLSLLRHRVLGPARAPLPQPVPGYWLLRRSGVARCRRRAGAAYEGHWRLDDFEHSGQNGPLQVRMHGYGFATTFLVEHYALRHADIVIEAAPGDVVLDGGACWGDTALYFADRVGKVGQVYCFEVDPDNLRILDRNLAMNPALRQHIDVSPLALWDKSGQTLGYVQQGPGTRTSEPVTGEETVTTIAIDDFVASRGLSRVDLIKMDIEGAELRALRGADQTLRRFRPKLAISAYHKPEDLYELPQYLVEHGYEIYLHHYTTHHEETVLFARHKL
jgi:FkbM family methyltransferase